MDKIKAELFSIPGVVSVGRVESGYKVQMLKGYPTLQVPFTISGERVFIEFVEELPRPPMQAYIDALRERRRPLFPGQQIQVNFGTGSAGFFVWWQGKQYMITAAHLIPEWTVGDLFWQPSRAITRIIGTLSRWIDIYQYGGSWAGVQGDVMAVELDEEGINVPLGGTEATYFARPELGTEFIRYGRTTGRREDVIVEVDATVRMAGVGDNPNWSCHHVFKGRHWSALGGDSGGGIFTKDGGVLGICMHPQGGCAITPSMRALGMEGAGLEREKVKQKQMDVAPQLINSRTMVPVRFVAEGLGARVDWDGTERSVTITKDDRRVKMWIGETQYEVSEGV